MPIKVACRHCGVALAVADGHSGLVRCPSCSRSTQYPPPATERELPPSQSDLRSREVAPRSSSGGGCTLAIAAVCLLAGGVFVGGSISTDSDFRGIRQAGIACFFAIAARIFQSAAYAQWRK